MEGEPQKKITLRIIADKAKVSRMTVSRALRNDPSIPRATCLKIQRIAKHTGYRPDPILTRLMETIRRGRRVHAPSNGRAYPVHHTSGYTARLRAKRDPSRPGAMPAVSSVRLLVVAAPME